VEYNISGRVYFCWEYFLTAESVFLKKENGIPSHSYQKNICMMRERRRKS
jgi:hypothetical protein